MNALGLYHDMRKRGVALEALGGNLRADAPLGVLTEEDRLALKSLKPALLRFLSRPPEKPVRKSVARWAGHGWIEILDPVAEEWHEVRASECLPGVVAEANSRRKGGTV